MARPFEPPLRGGLCPHNCFREYLERVLVASQLEFSDKFSVRLGEAVHLEERDFFIDNALVRIQLIIEKTLGDRPCAMGV